MRALVSVSKRVQVQDRKAASSGVLAAIGVEISRADPRQDGRFEVGGHVAQRRDRLPQMMAGSVERETAGGAHAGRDGDVAADAAWQGHGRLVDRDLQPFVDPTHAAGADGDLPGVAPQRAAAALGHGPAPRPAVQRHVHAHVVFRVAAAARAGQGVEGREHAADESDDRQPVPAVGAQRVDVPPRVTVLPHHDVEARLALTRSSSSAAAASRPDIAAIGTPGPGCTLPPAR